MSKRGVLTVLLTFAFLLSAWGNVIAAAFCPRYQTHRECSVKLISQEPPKAAPASSCHHDMAEMEMDDMQMGESDVENMSDVESSADVTSSEIGSTQSQTQTSTQLVIDLPNQPCSLCWMHSQPASATVLSVAVDPTKQLSDTSAPSVAFAFVAPTIVTAFITPVEHGPPGNLLPRHVLINVFRI